jgi:hypothetical protein
MIGRRRSEFESSGSGSLLTSVRDVVEILAIIAAGIWAFYTFVYENQIKPANSQPVGQIEGSLTRLGEKDGLIAVQSHLEIKNVGQTDIWLYGVAETVLGSTVRKREPHATIAPRTGEEYSLTDDVGWTKSDPKRAFAFGILANIADPRSSNGWNLRVGNSVPFDRVFYVAAGRYDELQTVVSLRFAARRVPQAFRLEPEDQILTIEQVGTGTNDIVGAENETVATLSLWR